MVRAIFFSLMMLIATILVDYTVKCSGIRSPALHFSTSSQKSHDKNIIEKKHPNDEEKVAATKTHRRELQGDIEDLLSTVDTIFTTVDDIANVIDTVNTTISTVTSIVDSLCFSAYNDVEVQGKGIVPMNSVKVGDCVRVFRLSSSSSSSGINTNNKNNCDGDYSRVFSLAHLDHDFETKFLQLHYDLHAEGKGAKLSKVAQKPLEITGRHMMYVVGKGFIRADEVRIGDELQIYLHPDSGSDENPKRIINRMTTALVNKIGSVNRKGVYAPITESGDLIVSGVRASSYYAFLDGIPSSVQHTLTHFFFAPHRLLCSNYDFGLCESETHTDDGYTNWAYWAIKIMTTTNKVVVWTPFQYILASISFPILLTVYILEQITIAVLMIIGMILSSFTTTTVTLVTIPFVYNAMMLNTKQKDNTMTSNH